MTTTTVDIHFVDTVEEILDLDWQVPFEMEDVRYEFTDDQLDEIQAAFEIHNKIQLDGEALAYFRKEAQDVYTVGN